MSKFCPDQGRTRVYGEAYSLYAAAEKPRRTQIRAKRAIYEWKLARIFHAPAAFICKALRDAAEVFYCKSLITQQMGASGSARRVKIFQLKKKKHRATKRTQETVTFE